MLADCCGDVGQIELDGPATARLEVDEQRPLGEVEDVARVWFAVQQLSRSAVVAACSSPWPKYADEHFPVRVGEFGCEITAVDELLGLGDSIRESRCRSVDCAWRRAGVRVRWRMQPVRARRSPVGGRSRT